MLGKKLAGILVGLALALGLSAEMALAHKNLISGAVSFSANPAIAGTMVTITGTIAYTGAQGPGSAAGHTVFPGAGTPVSGVKLNIEELQLAGVGVPCGTALAAFVQIFSGTTNGSGQVSTLFDTTGLGGSTICFRTQNPAQDTGEGVNHGLDAHQSPGLDLMIISPCTPGATVGATLAAGDGTPAPAVPLAGPWVFRITVTACGSVTGVTAQGGTNGWAPLTGFLPSIGSVSVKNNRRNQVLHWTIGSMTDGQTATLDVTVNGPIPLSTPDCELRYLSGPWSTTFSTDGGLTFQKSLYSGRVSVSVDTDGDGNPACP